MTSPRVRAQDHLVELALRHLLVCLLLLLLLRLMLWQLLVTPPLSRRSLHPVLTPLLLPLLLRRQWLLRLRLWQCIPRLVA